MRLMPYLIKNPHGVYCAQRKVPSEPKGLQAAVAKLLNNGKAEQKFLKRSLHTKDPHEANVRVKPVLIVFDKLIRDAKALVEPTSTAPLPRAGLQILDR
jgi:hypothetical protein